MEGVDNRLLVHPPSLPQPMAIPRLTVARDPAKLIRMTMMLVQPLHDGDSSSSSECHSVHPEEALHPCLHQLTQTTWLSTRSLLMMRCKE